MPFRTLLFDLDGTLTDSQPGITSTICRVLDDLRQPHPPAEQLTWCVGPALIDSFRTLLGDRAHLADEAMRLYERHYTDGAMFQSQLYPEVIPSLQALRQTGRRLVVVTGKPVHQATPILRHFGLLTLFERVYGPTPDDRDENKARRLALVLADLQEAPERCVYVGDRRGDIDGAHANGIRAMAASYGYGAPQELADADAMADSPSDWLNALRWLEWQGGEK